MNSWWHSRRAWLAPWLMWLAWPVLAQGGGAAVAPFDIRWEVERTVRLPQDRGVRTEARFVVEATASQLLGAGGWALYFTCLAEADEGPALGPFVLERVNGTLYRLRPTAGFRGMTAGQPLHLRFRHPGPMPLPDRAPQGPYLVFDSDPDRGLAPQRYRVVVPARGEQLDVATGARLPGPAAEELFARHAAVADLPASALPPVFPTPRALQRSGGTLAWRAMPRIDAAAALAGEATLAREMLQPFFAPGSVARGPSARLRLSVGAVAGQSSPEAYELRVDRGHGVAIRGASAAGVARGLQSLRSLLPLSHQPAAGVALPALVVRDAPRFEHRGLLLDVARHFHPKETVLRVIDLMARFKLNKLHLHLTDDEGWRLAIPGLPELTEFGARRGHSADPWRHLPPAHGSGPDASRSSGSGFYDAEEYKHILSYAAARHVEVIPEIEMPGHARAAVKAMQLRAQRRSAAGAPDAQRFLLADPGDRSRYRSPQLHDDHLMDPGLESTYAFVEHVVGALATLHREAGVPLRPPRRRPSRATRWPGCRACGTASTSGWPRYSSATASPPAAGRSSAPGVPVPMAAGGSCPTSTSSAAASPCTSGTTSTTPTTWPIAWPMPATGPCWRRRRGCTSTWRRRTSRARRASTGPRSSTCATCSTTCRWRLSVRRRWCPASPPARPVSMPSAAATLPASRRRCSPKP